jgi:hypothetical protein
MRSGCGKPGVLLKKAVLQLFICNLNSMGGNIGNKATCNDLLMRHTRWLPARVVALLIYKGSGLYTLKLSKPN